MYITGISKLFEPSKSLTLKIDQMLVVLLSVPDSHEHGVSTVVLCTSHLKVCLVPDLYSFLLLKEKISCTDHVRNEEVLLRVNEQRNILHEIKKRKANWIGRTLRRTCF